MTNFKEWEVEFISTTCRVFYVNASTQDEAEAIATEQLNDDGEISTAWRENAELNHVEVMGE
jgi:hypothetical protein